MTPPQPGGKAIFGIENLKFTASVMRTQEDGSVQSPQDLQAPALELGTLKPEFLGRNLVQTFKKSR